MQGEREALRVWQAECVGPRCRWVLMRYGGLLDPTAYLMCFTDKPLQLP